MKKIAVFMFVAAVVGASQADAANDKPSKFSSWVDDTFGIYRLLDCNSPKLHKMVQDAVADDFLVLAIDGVPQMSALKDGTRKEDQAMKRLFVKLLKTSDVKVCRPVKDSALPAAVIQFINPSTRQLGGVVMGYGAGRRGAAFGSTED